MRRPRSRGVLRHQEREHAPKLRDLGSAFVSVLANGLDRHRAADTVRTTTLERRDSVPELRVVRPDTARSRVVLPTLGLGRLLGGGI